jgi:dual specificity phosphatase 12
MEDQLILLHFRECIQFIHDALRDPTNAVLVHCVYGQSRSASICVAFLMAERNMPMTAAYDSVHGARPCIHINRGFLMQLQLFQRMGNDANLLGASNAHAEVRAQRFSGSVNDPLTIVVPATCPARRARVDS